MKRFLGLFVFVFVAALFFSLPTPTLAQRNICENTYNLDITPAPNPLIQRVNGRNLQITVVDSLGELARGFPGTSFTVCIQSGAQAPTCSAASTIPRGNTTFNINTDLMLAGSDEYRIFINETTGINNFICESNQNVTITANPPPGQTTCNWRISQGEYTDMACLESNSPITFNISGATLNGQPFSGGAALYTSCRSNDGALINIENGSGTLTTPNFSPSGPCSFIIKSALQGIQICQTPPAFSLQPICDPSERTPVDTKLGPAPFYICNQATGEDDKNKCLECSNKAGIWTGLGCIRYNTKELVEDLMKILFGVAGGIALVLMLYGAFTYATAGGDPKKAQQAKEVFGGAVTGLLLIIFSIIILNFIGITILQLPGF